MSTHLARKYTKYPELEGKSQSEKNKKYYQEYRDRKPWMSLFSAAKDRAKKKGLEFNLVPEDISIPEMCPILNIPIICKAGHGNPGGKMNSPSLDRIDNNKGYTKDNIQVISHQANSMKFTATKEHLLAFAKWVFTTYHD